MAGVTAALPTACLPLLPSCPVQPAAGRGDGRSGRHARPVSAHGRVGVGGLRGRQGGIRGRLPDAAPLAAPAGTRAAATSAIAAARASAGGAACLAPAPAAGCARRAAAAALACGLLARA